MDRIFLLGWWQVIVLHPIDVRVPASRRRTLHSACAASKISSYTRCNGQTNKCCEHSPLRDTLSLRILIPRSAVEDAAGGFFADAPYRYHAICITMPQAIIRFRGMDVARWVSGSGRRK